MKNAVRSFLPLALGLLMGGIGSVCPARAQIPTTSGGVVTLQHPTDDGYDDLLNALYALPQRPPAHSWQAPYDPQSFFDRLNYAPSGDWVTLAEKRAILRDKRVRDALGYLRDALNKPQLTRVRSAQEQGKLDGRWIDGPKFASLRCALSVKVYVELADGATASAIDTFAQSLALADALGRWDIDGAMSAMVLLPFTINPLALHMDRLSEEDCRRLVSLLKRELDAPNPVVDGLRADAKADVERVDKCLRVQNLSGLAPADQTTITKLRATGGADWAGFVAASKAAAVKDCNDIADALAGYPQTLEDALAAPPPERSESERDALAYKIVWASKYVSPPSENHPTLMPLLLDDFARRTAQLKLLAVHAAIHQYKWEHNALPPSLDALRIGTLANDPYVAGSMRYDLSKDGKSYELSCAGPTARFDEHDQPTTHGKRKPVMLPYTGLLAP